MVAAQNSNEWRPGIRTELITPVRSPIIMCRVCLQDGVRYEALWQSYVAAVWRGMGGMNSGEADDQEGEGDAIQKATYLPSNDELNILDDHQFRESN